KKENLRLVPKISSYWEGEEHNQLVMAQMEKQGFTVHFTDELEIIEKPVKPTLEAIKHENRFYNYTDEELQEDLDEAMEEHMLAQERYDTALDHGFEKGILLHTDTYKTEEAFVKVREVSTD